MSTLIPQDQQTQRGFTLVELAIVLVIIGLLLGGILKGQELIASTKVNTTTAQVKAIEAAAYTFEDTYGGRPGDIANPTARLPNCVDDVGACNPATTNLGNGQVNGSILDAQILDTAGTPTTEGTAFFNQLYVANLISGLTTGSNTLAVGQTLLGASLDNSAHWRIGYHTANLGGMGGTTENNNHYIALVGGVAGAAVTTAAATDTIPTGGGILPKQAGAIDSKIDDGNPSLGSIRALGVASTDGTPAATECMDEQTAGQEFYNSAVTDKICGVVMKILQ